MGPAAGADPHPLFHPQLYREFGVYYDRTIDRRGNAHHRDPGAPQPPGQGPGVPVARREGLARPVGRGRHNR